MKPYDVIVEAHDIQGLMTALYLVSRRRRVAVIAPPSARDKTQGKDYKMFCGSLGGLKEDSLFQLYWRTVQSDTKLVFEGQLHQPFILVDAQGIRREVPRDFASLRRYFVRYYARHHREIKQFFHQVMRWYEEFMMWESERQKGRPSVLSQVEIETFECSLETFLSRYFKDERLKQAFNLFAPHQALPLDHIDAWSYMLTFFNQVIEPNYQLHQGWPQTFDQWLKKLLELGVDVYEEDALVWREESDYTMLVQLASEKRLQSRWAVSVAKPTQEAVWIQSYDVVLDASFALDTFNHEWRLCREGDVSWLRVVKRPTQDTETGLNLRVQTTSTANEASLFTYLDHYFKGFSKAVVEVLNPCSYPLIPAQFKPDKSLEALSQNRQFLSYFVTTHHVSLPIDVFAQAGLFGRLRLGVTLGEVVHEGLFKKATHLQGRPETELVARLLFDYSPSVYPLGHRLKLDFGKTELMIVCEDEAKFYVGSKEPHETLKLDFDALLELVENATTKEEALTHLGLQERAQASLFLDAFGLVSNQQTQGYEPFNKPWGMALFISFMVLLGVHTLGSILFGSLGVTLTFLGLALSLGVVSKSIVKWSLSLPLWVSALLGLRVLFWVLDWTFLAHVEFVLMALVFFVYAFKQRSLCWVALYKDHPPYEASRQFFTSYARGLSWLWSLAWLLMYLITALVPWPNILLAGYVLVVMSVITIRYEALYLASRTKEMRR